MQQRAALFFALTILAVRAAPAQTPPADIVAPPPTAQAWAAIALLPDLSGTWAPDIRDQDKQISANPVPWTPAVQKQVDHWNAEEAAGRPKGLFINCLPLGMPSFMMLTHNSIEFLLSPGRVTILGDSDGNRLRRIYTDGRPMPEDPDPSFHGYSVGRWVDGTLAVDTKAILPQAYIAVSEAVGIPNGGDMSISEKIHLIGPDTLAFDLEITAPHVLARPWQTRRLYHRRRQRSFEIVEGVCRQGDFHDGTDPWGNPMFEPTNQENGNLLPKSAK